MSNTGYAATAATAANAGNSSNLSRIGQDLVELALPVLLVAAASALLVFILLRLVKAPASRELMLFPLSFAILGGTAGAIAGSSFEPLVGALVTGVLGIVSAMITYAFTKSGDRNLRAALPPIVILLLLNALVGLSIGRTWKIKWDNYATRLDRYRTNRSEIWIPVTREYRLAVMRKCLAEAKTVEESLKRCNYGKLFPKG